MSGIKNKVSSVLKQVGTFFLSVHLSQNSKKEKNKYLNERVNEYAFAFETLSNGEYFNVLDVGTGDNSFASTLEHCGFNVTASDSMGSYWSTFSNRHIHVVKDDITNSNFKSDSMDAILCISVLEHIHAYHLAMGQMSRIVKKGGVIVATFPYSHDAFCENIYKLEGSDSLSKKFSYIARSYSDDQIEKWCIDFDLEIIGRRYLRGWTGKFWRTGERIGVPYATHEKAEANCICLALKKL